MFATKSTKEERKANEEFRQPSLKEEMGQETLKATDDELGNLLPVHLGDETYTSKVFNRLIETPNDQLKNISQSEATYLKFEDYTKEEKAEGIPFIFCGFENITKDGQLIECVCLIDPNGSKFIAGSRMLVNSLKKVTKMPCGIKITVADKKTKGKNGDYFEVGVFVL